MTEEERKFSKDFSMPNEWLHVLAQPSTKDKAALLYRLKYEMTISDVHDLMEYHEYENWLAYEEYVKAKNQKQ